MAIRLLSHLWRAAPTTGALATSEPRHDWRFEAREPSTWNPRLEPDADAAWPPLEQRPPDSIWAETQPCCHD
jgi:hypothetical protein